MSMAMDARTDSWRSGLTTRDERDNRIVHEDNGHVVQFALATGPREGSARRVPGVATTIQLMSLLAGLLVELLIRRGFERRATG
jgi:hypothetical protein